VGPEEVTVIHEVRVERADVRTVRCGALAVVLEGEEPLAGEAALLDDALGGEIAARRTLGELTPGGEAAALAGAGRVAAGRVRVAAADLAARGVHGVRDAAARLGRGLGGVAADELALLPPVASRSGDPAGWVRAAVEGLLLGLHRTASLARDDARPPLPSRLTVLLRDGLDEEAVGTAVREARIVAEAVGWARDRVDGPPNRVTPAALADTAAEAARAAGMRVSVLDPDAMRERGMGALLAVGQGSAHPPRLVVLEHRGDQRDLPSLAWVGKGVTFDSGGLSLKERTAMPEMKGDMAGAAAVLAAAVAVARLDLPVRTVAVAACVENMPDGAAYRPADVVTAADGTAIEIVSTDAEGRLALADALLHARGYETQATADVATLTGGAVVALGKGTAAAAFANDEAWLGELRDAADAADEPIWPLPIYDAYLRAIDSRVADLKNGGVREGSAGIGAAFLRRFAPDRWAHLDIAGMAWTERAQGAWNEGATGYGVRLLVEAARRWSARGGPGGA
jgi:leucyl aminopeptidase